MTAAAAQASAHVMCLWGITTPILSWPILGHRALPQSQPDMTTRRQADMIRSDATFTASIERSPNTLAPKVTRQNLIIIWTVYDTNGASLVALFMEFPRQEYWSGLPFPSPGDLPDPRIKLPNTMYLGWGFFIKKINKLIYQQQWAQNSMFNEKLGTSVVVQWLRLHTLNAGGQGLIPDQGIRYHMPQLKIKDPVCRI